MDVLNAVSRLRSTGVYSWPASVRAEQTVAQGASCTVGDSRRARPASSMLCAPSAAARSMDEAAANAAITNAACAPDLEAPLDKSVAGSTVGPICRICLSAGSAEQKLIQPCACTGTVGYIHAACLTAWVQERGSLTCKICQQQYKEPFAQALQQHQQTAAAEEGREERQTGTISCCKWPMNYGIGQVIAFLIITSCILSVAVFFFATGGVGGSQL